MQCQNPIKEEYFCNNNCLTKWVNSNFNSFSSHSTTGESDKGTKCNKCEKKVSDAHNEIDKKNIPELVKHLENCLGKVDPLEIPDKKKLPKDKPTDKGDKKLPRPDELCEQCGVSCIIYQTKTSYTIRRKRYIKHKTDFTRESSVWFGTNCPCARQFREANQQTCPQCKKREFPHMKRGWLLDYEIKKAFCSPLCHVTYRGLKWEEAQRLTQVEMFPPELDVEVNPRQNTNSRQNINWEQEGLRREVLFLRETVRELEARLNNQTNLTPEERLQSSYLRNLQQNTLRNAERNYTDRYGSLTENNPSGNKDKGMSGGVIALIIGGGIVLVIGIVFLLMRNKNKRYE